MRMMRNFLKTRIGIALLIALFFVIGATVFKVASNKPQQSALSQKVSVIANESVKNSVANGSYDFEGALNVLASTSDEITGLGGASSKGEPSTDAPVTATDLFARELFTRYAEAKKNGKDIDEVTQNDIAEMVLSNDYSGQRKLVAESELNISADTSRTALRAYGNALAKAIFIPAIKGDHELAILEKSRDAGELTNEQAKTLDLIIKRYKGISEALMAMPVPKSAAATHATLVNGVNLLTDGAEGVITLYTDPIGALTKIKYYENGLNLVSAAMIRFKAYFISNGVVFSSTEGGYKILQ